MDHPDTAGPDELTGHLVGLWRELLDPEATGLPEIAPESNFFVQGGHSLLGVTLLARVEETTGCRLRLVDLFKHPTPVRLAAQLRAAHSDIVIAQ
ncbi:phosphopantetheine-binding protein [Streptomyces parvus]|uniref:Acyl carrier protein n=1 Tax=Streptomyces parvus TaxID=66428 RepID=A0A7K3RSN6_9ACTN|nr:acyl carrier protein [Streptomyces parvus]